MALFNRLFGSRNSVADLATQLSNIQTQFAEVSQTNAMLQQLLNIQFQKAGGFTRFDTVNTSEFILNGFNISSAVYSITYDIAKKATSIPLKVYEVVDDKALKSYRQFKGQRQTPENSYYTRKFRTKALRDVPDDNPLQVLIDNPNPDDDPATFYQTAILFNLITGNEFIYTPILEAGADQGKVTQLRIMPSQFTGIVLREGYPPILLGYELIVNGVMLLKTNEVIHIKNPNLNWSIDGQQLYGLSPLQAALRTLRRSNSAETSATAMFDNGGPAVIVYNKSISPDQFGNEQIGKLKKNLNSEYSGNENRGKIKLSAGDIGVAQLGLSPVDLNILESEKWSFDMLCNVFGQSSILYNNHSASTESNVKEMRRDSWLRGPVPQRQAQADAFNRKIVPAYNTKGTKYFIDLDLSGIMDLQPDMTAMATWLSTSWWVAPNEKRKMQDFDESADPNMNKIWMPTGMQTMDDASINVNDLPNAPNDNTNIGSGNAVQ